MISLTSYTVYHTTYIVEKPFIQSERKELKCILLLSTEQFHMIKSIIVDDELSAIRSLNWEVDKFCNLVLKD